MRLRIQWPNNPEVRICDLQPGDLFTMKNSMDTIYIKIEYFNGFNMVNLSNGQLKSANAPFPVIPIKATLTIDAFVPTEQEEMD